jgi:hypothetical protein
MWLQEEEYSEFVIGLHWIFLRNKGLCKGLSKKGVCSSVFFWAIYRSKAIQKEISEIDSQF